MLAALPLDYETRFAAAIVDALVASGAKAEHVFLKDRGLRGNGHMAMLENNRTQVFEFFSGWVNQVGG